MKTGMIFTGVVSYFVAGGAIVAGEAIYRYFKKIDLRMAAYGFFLLTTGVTWFFIASELILGWLGMSQLEKICFMANQVVLFTSGMPLAYYLALGIFENKKIAEKVVWFYFILAILVVASLHVYGIELGEQTYFANKWKLNWFGFIVFLTALTPLLFFAVYDNLKQFIKMVIRKERTDVYGFLYTLYLTVYLVLGAFDEQGLIAGWPLVFFRLMFAAIFMGAYITFYFQVIQKEQFIEKTSK